MCRIDSSLKKLIRLKYSILETLLPNQFRIHCRFKQQLLQYGKGRGAVGRYSTFSKKGENLIWGIWHVIGELDNLCRRPYIGLHDKLQNLFPINGNSFQGKPKF